MHVIGLPYFNCIILFQNSQLHDSYLSFNYIFLHEIMDRAWTQSEHSYGSIFNKEILWPPLLYIILKPAWLSPGFLLRQFFIRCGLTSTCRSYGGRNNPMWWEWLISSHSAATGNGNTAFNLLAYWSFMASSSKMEATREDVKEQRWGGRTTSLKVP